MQVIKIVMPIQSFVHTPPDYSRHLHPPHHALNKEACTDSFRKKNSLRFGHFTEIHYICRKICQMYNIREKQTILFKSK